jgi:hypothetical protein
MYPARLCHNNKTLGLDDAISGVPRSSRISVYPDAANFYRSLIQER